MAFHVACPITCRRICFCPLGFPRSLATANSKAAFLDDVIKVHRFLDDPSGARARDEGSRTVQVVVPKVLPVPAPPPPILVPVVAPKVVGEAAVSATAAAVVVVEDESAASASAQAKRAALQRKAAADMVAAEDYARRFESGDLSDNSKGAVGEEHGQSNVMCRICYSGENEGSEKARRMLPCKTCGKKYHRNCLKSWSQHRDLFHWSAWACPSCRICEVCRRTGDPNKLMFCKRCDGAYHCYCQHPSHKNVSAGVYVCPKHTKCHSCGSNVPGNGLSVRWFLGYTCCDACGRLFVKGNYCPVCLKVYRDSESTPMVCCDICEHWVHCHCDGISDEKYQQFQLDGNLQYRCATCRGECHKVKNHEDAAKELWKRKDEAERDIITSLRAAAGLPAHEEILSIPPYSDDEETGPPKPKSEYGRSLKLSLKGLVDKSPKKTKDSAKKSLIRIPAKKREYHEISDSSAKNDVMQSSKNTEIKVYSSRLAGNVSHNEDILSVSEPSALKHKLVDEVMSNGGDRTSKVRIKGRSHGLDSGEDTEKHASKSKPVKEKKLVINFGAKKINITKSPISDASTHQREHAPMSSNGGADVSQKTTSRSLENRHDGSANVGDAKGSKVAGREGNVIKLGKVRSGAPNNPKLVKDDAVEGLEGTLQEQVHVSSGKNNKEDMIASEPAAEIPTMKPNKVYSRKHSESRSGVSAHKTDESGKTPISQSSSKDHKPLLKFKLKKPNLESQISLQPYEEKSTVKGQRSKRKRPSPFMEKTSFGENNDKGPSVEDNLMDEIMDANWILKKLGKDAVGKRVEVQQLSDNSWHKGVVTDVDEDTSLLSVTLDSGKVKSLELGKQGVRFVSHKQKRSRT